MVRNIAFTVLAIGLLVVFQPHIKAGILEAQCAFALSRTDIQEDKKAELRSAVSRIGDGFKRRAFTDVEIITLREQLAEMRSYAGKEMDSAVADGYLRKFETILERYQL